MRRLDSIPESERERRRQHMVRVRQLLAYEPLASPRGDYWRSLVAEDAPTPARASAEQPAGWNAIDMIALRLQDARVREADWDLFSRRQARAANRTLFA